MIALSALAVAAITLLGAVAPAAAVARATHRWCFPPSSGARHLDRAGARDRVHRRLHLERRRRRRGGCATRSRRPSWRWRASSGSRRSARSRRRRRTSSAARSRRSRSSPRSWCATCRPTRRYAEDAAAAAEPDRALPRRSSPSWRTSPSEEGASPYTRLPISALVEAAGALYHDPRVRLDLRDDRRARPSDEPLVRRSPEIMHGLSNLIQNAVQFARREVSVTTQLGQDERSRSRSSMTGPAFPPHLLGRLGEPYLSTRAGDTEPHGARHLHRAEPAGAQRRAADLRQSGRRRRACCHFVEACQFGGRGATRCRGDGRVGEAAAATRGNRHECERSNPSTPAARTAEAAPLHGLPESERTLLIVDDDAPLCQRLARAMERRGFVVATADGRRRAASPPRPRSRRPSRWSICGSATAAASTWSARCARRGPARASSC